MAKYTTTAKHNVPLYLAAALFCLALISVHLTSGLYAKYTSSNEGNDIARVIVFGDLTLTETGDFYAPGKLMIIPGVDLTKKAVIDFEGSEAATYVFAQVIPSANWSVSADGMSYAIVINGKNAMQWNITDGWNFLRNQDGSCVYFRKLDAQDGLDSQDIIKDGKITVSDRITKSEIASMANTFINLRAFAVQAGGFASADAAWDSVAAKEGT